MKYINYEVPETACPEGLDTPEEKLWAKAMTLFDEESNYLHMKHRTVIIVKFITVVHDLWATEPSGPQRVHTAVCKHRLC